MNLKGKLCTLFCYLTVYSLDVYQSVNFTPGEFFPCDSVGLQAQPCSTFIFNCLCFLVNLFLYKTESFVHLTDKMSYPSEDVEYDFQDALDGDEHRAYQVAHDALLFALDRAHPKLQEII